MNEVAIAAVPAESVFFIAASAGRDVITGPRFNNTGESARVQFRTEFFDLFNHANFGQPGNI